MCVCVSMADYTVRTSGSIAVKDRVDGMMNDALMIAGICCVHILK